MTGLILHRRKPGRHKRGGRPVTRREPGRSLGEYLDARSQGLALPTHHPAWLAEVKREWREQQNR